MQHMHVTDWDNFLGVDSFSSVCNGTIRITLNTPQRHWSCLALWFGGYTD